MAEGKVVIQERTLMVGEYADNDHRPIAVDTDGKALVVDAAVATALGTLKTAVDSLLSIHQVGGGAFTLANTDARVLSATSIPCNSVIICPNPDGSNGNVSVGDVTTQGRVLPASKTDGIEIYCTDANAVYVKGVSGDDLSWTAYGV